MTDTQNWTAASQKTTWYSYDDLGNRISKQYRDAAAIGYQHDKANRMTTLAGLTQNYDKAGNQTMGYSADRWSDRKKKERNMNPSRNESTHHSRTSVRTQNSLSAGLFLLLLATPVSAMNDPVIGRWLTRDPLYYNSFVIPNSAPNDFGETRTSQRDWLARRRVPKGISPDDGNEVHTLMLFVAALAMSEELHTLGTPPLTLLPFSDSSHTETGAAYFYEYAASSSVHRLDPTGLVWCYDWTTDWFGFHEGWCFREVVVGYAPAGHFCISWSWPPIANSPDQCGPACGVTPDGYCIFCANQVLCHLFLDVIPYLLFG